jgi:hypothetical protein
MKKKRPLSPGIPATGQILRYIVRALGLPTKDIPGITDKDFDRLDSGDFTDETALEKIKLIVDRVVLPDTGGFDYTPSTTALADLLNPNSPFATRFAANKHGDIIFDPNELARLIWQFLYFSSVHRARLGKEFAGPEAFESWLLVFVIPFISAHLAELKAFGVDWEKGMPGGQHWYMPNKARIADKRSPKIEFLGTPVQTVLNWWQDILGCCLSELAHELCPGDAQGESAARQIRKWMSDGHVFSFATIERWTLASRNWNYQGSFEDVPSLPLCERWQKCKQFLVKKDMVWRKDWRGDLGGGENASQLRDSYRGEPLEREIPPFQKAGIPFARFFEVDDPISAGLPVEALIERVAYRWSKPNNSQLRTRLLIACAMQRAAEDLTKRTSARMAFGMLGDFERIYNVVFSVLNSSEIQTVVDDSRTLTIAMLRNALVNEPRLLMTLETVFADSIEPTTELLWLTFLALSESKNKTSRPAGR